MFIINGEFHAKNCRKCFSNKLMLMHAPKCWEGPAYMRKKQTCTSMLSVKTNAVFKLLKHLSSKKCAPRNNFPLSPFRLN